MKILQKNVITVSTQQKCTYKSYQIPYNYLTTRNFIPVDISKLICDIKYELLSEY